MKRSVLLMLMVLAPFTLCAQTESVAAPEPQLDINSASQAELEALPGIGPERAKWMAATRTRNGAFRCVEELRAMPRLSDRQFDSLRPLVFVANPDPRCQTQQERPTN